MGLVAGVGVAHEGRPIRSCPVCGSEIHEILYEQRFAEFAAGSITDGYYVVACRKCGMCFASGLPDPDRFSLYYDESSKYDLSAEGAELSRFEAGRYTEEAQFIAAHVADRARPVLDVGTATGGLLAALRDAGFTSVHGVEPSEGAARVARELHGLDVIAGEIQAAKVWGPGFSVVSLVAVLEHLVDPRGTLRDAGELLAPEGMLYLVVPDAARFADYLDAPYQQFSVEHINYFTRDSLANLIASAGFGVSVERAFVVEQSDDANGPAIEMLCRRTDRDFEPAPDSNGVHELRRYITWSAEKESAVIAKISELADEQSRIYVWGTGTNALHLLASSRLAECNIAAFLDSNPHYTGKRLAGRTVLAPGDVKVLDAPIIVASAVSQTAIATAARGLFGPDAPLILLY